MKIQLILGLCLSASLLLAGPTAMADNGKDKPKNARAMQVQIDKKTGKIMNEATDEVPTSARVEADTIVDAKGMMPVEAEPQQYHADGTVSAKLGTENLEYLVITIGEDGEKRLSHQKEDDLNLKAVEQDKGEK
jgi:hypothetical protein